MARVNIYSSNDPYDDSSPKLLGWFDPDHAVESIREGQRWDGNDHIGVMSGLQCGYEYLYRTPGGRWVRHYNARSQFNGTEYYEFLTDEQAHEWLLRDGDDELAKKYFGEIPDEKGPGQPEIGNPVHLRLGDLLDEVDAWAGARGVSRAKAVRQLITQGLGVTASEPAPRPTLLTVDPR